MPFYDYECNDCNNVFEVFASAKSFNPDILKCSQCKSSNTQVILSTPSFKVTGEGACDKRFKK